MTIAEATEPPRRVRVGGLGRDALLAALEERGIALNEMARTLFAHPAFTTAAAGHEIEIAVTDLAGLALADGATMPQILAAATRRGWVPAPLELAPWLRLQWIGQAGIVAEPTRRRAPPGSLTVISPPPAAGPEVPRGFYLRRAGGRLWLRGYRSDDLHRWAGCDRLVFAVAS